MELDDSGFDVGSGLADIVRTNWAFQYSSARLVCSNHVLNVSGGTLERIACIGYLEGTGARVELAGHLTNGVGTLVFHNIDRNVYSRASEGLRLVCALQNYP